MDKLNPPASKAPHITARRTDSETSNPASFSSITADSARWDTLMDELLCVADPKSLLQRQVDALSSPRAKLHYLQFIRMQQIAYGVEHIATRMKTATSQRGALLVAVEIIVVELLVCVSTQIEFWERIVRENHGEYVRVRL
jgi:hypothetical protein